VLADFDPNKCRLTNDWRKFLLSVNILDLLIDICVTFYFIRYIIRGNQNEQEVSKSIVWNGPLIGIVFIRHVNALTLTLTLTDSLIGYLIEAITFILISYIITFNPILLTKSKEDKDQNHKRKILF
jgi:hypothetical protein